MWPHQDGPRQVWHGTGGRKCATPKKNLATDIWWNMEERRVVSNDCLLASLIGALTVRDQGKTV